jgi:Tfp pilus assembly protein PilV
LIIIVDHARTSGIALIEVFAPAVLAAMIMTAMSRAWAAMADPYIR